MLYSSKSYLEKIWLPTKYDTWLAHYTDKTNYSGNYKYWQICDDGIIDGIDGAVDIDIMYLD
jgi:GH25 family lysozyme M1 (1,4-beta-N-acetylmuramidase)